MKHFKVPNKICLSATAFESRIFARKLLYCQPVAVNLHIYYLSAEIYEDEETIYVIKVEYNQKQFMTQYIQYFQI